MNERFADLPVGVIFIDAAGVVRRWNDTAAALLAVPATDALGRRFVDLDVSYLVAGLHAAIETAGQEARKVDVRNVEVRRGEQTHHVDIMVRPSVGGDRVNGITVYVADVTDLVRLREEVTHLTQERSLELGEAEASREALEVTVEALSVANQELQTANDALTEVDSRKNEFIAMLSHELRNPLAAVAGAVDILGGDELSPRAARALAVARRQMRHLGRMLDDLLDVSRISHGRLWLRTRPLDLRDVVREAVEATHGEVEAAGLTATVTAASVPLPVDGDDTRLVQVLVNLLRNSVRYTPRGGRILIGARGAASTAVVTVTDTGRGIAATRIASIFEPFEQEADEAGRRGAGLGLGLALAREIVERHGGTLTAKSSGLGRGSTFTVMLPLIRAEVEPVQAAPTAPGRSRHVLIVEDNDDVRQMLIGVLQLAGHRVDVAHSGMRAVEVALAVRPEVMLIDIGLPDVDGYEVARRVRSALGDTVALVAVTGYGETADRDRSRDAGFLAHVVKPVDPDALAAVLRSV